VPTYLVRCPKCGHKFLVEVKREMKKGRGAWYSFKIKKLTPLHEHILMVLYKHGPLPKRRIGGILADEGRRVSGNSLSGRLSELAGLGLIECEWSEVKLFDANTMTFRFRKLPVWRLTRRGIIYVKEKLLRQ